MEIPINVLLTTAGFIFTILSGALGMMIKALNRNTEAYQEMKVYITGFVAKQETADSYEEKDCISKHSYIGLKLKDLSLKSQEHTLAISQLIETSSVVREHSAKLAAHSQSLQDHEHKFKEIGV